MSKMVLTLATAIATLGAGWIGSINLAQLAPAQAAAAFAAEPEHGDDAAEDQGQGEHRGAPEHMMPGRHIEGRLAFLRTELKITDAQTSAWEKYAAALRDHAAKADALIGPMHKKDPAGVDLLAHMETRAKLADLEATSSRSELDAFRPLYASFSDEQKRSAAELLGHHHPHHFPD